VFTSLKAGAGFKKEIKKSAPTYKLGLGSSEKNPAHSRSFKKE